MLAACCFLPFLPLIEDAMIRQLGDDDFAKRDAATRFLERFLRDTDGIKNQWAFIRIREAKEHPSPEVRRRAEFLYDRSKSRYILGYTRFLVVVKDVTPKEFQGTNKISFDGLKKEIGYGLDDSDCSWGTAELGKEGTRYTASFTSSLCTAKRFYYLWNNKNILMFIPTPKPLHGDILIETIRTGKGWGIRAP